MKRPKYLFILPTSCQMYSGTGKAAFDWIKYSRHIFDFDLLCDSEDEENFSIIREFCNAERLKLLVSDSYRIPGCPDTGIADIPYYAADGRYDVIETVSWANAATNCLLLDSISNQQRVVYTPHTQPMWTLGEPTRFSCVLPVYRAMISRSDLVLLDSPCEFEALDLDGVQPRSALYVPLGVNETIFFDEGLHQPNRVLCIGDYREHRKRFDLMLSAFYQACNINPDLNLTVIGKNSHLIKPDPRFSHRVHCKGYVEADAIIKAYKEASLFLLLSDYEAFGLPIAEALCCGAEVIINDQKSTRQIFSGLSGVNIVNNVDTHVVAKLIARISRSILDHNAVSLCALERFRFVNTYGRKLEAIMQLI